MNTRFVAIVCASFSLSCGDARTAEQDPWAGQVSIPEDGRVHLVSSPRTLLATVEPTILSAAVGIGELDHDILHLADVSLFDDGKLAVLDRGDGRIRLFHPDGRHIRSLSRRGEGQSELLHPFGLTAVGGQMVVWSLGPNKVLSVFDSTGLFVRSTPPPTDGDWNKLMFRLPVSREKEYHVPLAEDLTDRISEYGSGHFLHSTRPDETLWYDDPTYSSGFVPDEIVIRYSLDFTEVDTLAVLEGPPSTKVEAQRQNAPPFWQVVSGPRDHWVGRDGTLVTSHDRKRRIVAFGSEGDTTLVVSWGSGPEPMSEESKVRKLDWIFVRDSIRLGDSRWEDRQWTEADRNSWTDDLLQMIPFSETDPEIGWLGLSGRCLLVAPWDPSANILGVSLSLLVFGLESRGFLGAVEIPRPGGRLRTAGLGRIWATHLDSFGGQVLEGFPIPFSECGG